MGFLEPLQVYRIRILVNPDYGEYAIVPNSAYYVTLLRRSRFCHADSFPQAEADCQPCGFQTAPLSRWEKYGSGGTSKEAGETT